MRFGLPVPQIRAAIRKLFNCNRLSLRPAHCRTRRSATAGGSRRGSRGSRGVSPLFLCFLCFLRVRHFCWVDRGRELRLSRRVRLLPPRRFVKEDRPRPEGAPGVRGPGAADCELPADPQPCPAYLRLFPEISHISFLRIALDHLRGQCLDIDPASMTGGACGVADRTAPVHSALRPVLT
jgi:hypothetical protein